MLFYGAKKRKKRVVPLASRGFGGKREKKDSLHEVKEQEGDDRAFSSRATSKKKGGDAIFQKSEHQSIPM